MKTHTDISVQHIREFLQTGQIENAAKEIIGLSLYAESYALAEKVLLELSKHENPNIKGNALLGLGHLARVHGKSSKEAVAAIAGALSNPDAYVRGQADSAADDVDTFSNFKVRK